MGTPFVMDLFGRRAEPACTRTAADDFLSGVPCLKHVPGTYDTYECTDCAITLAGYKLADKFLDEHVLRNTERGVRCRYLEILFTGRECELYKLRGLVRFQMGKLAYPSELLYATSSYTTQSRCVVCSQTKDGGHHLGCEDMRTRVKTFLRSAKLLHNPLGGLIVTSNQPGAGGHCSKSSFANGPFGGICHFPMIGIKNHDGTISWPRDNFTWLGEDSNMKHVLGTRDTHRCSECCLQVHDLGVEDTLLGEHIFHRYNHGGSCPFLEKNYSSDKIATVLARERYRRGMMGSPNGIFESSNGFHATTSTDTHRCIICNGANHPQCSAFTTVNQQIHHAQCNEMANALVVCMARIVLLPSV